jgi:short-subunit dehydrogenase
VLVARRESLLDEVGQGLAKDFSVRYRNVVADLSQDGFLDKLAEATNDLDIGLVVLNAGTGNPGEFLKLDRQLLQETLRLKYDGASGCHPPFRRETRRAEAGRLDPRGGNECGKRHSLFGE